MNDLFFLIFGLIVSLLVGVSLGILIERARMDKYLRYLIANNEALERQCRKLLEHSKGGERYE